MADYQPNAVLSTKEYNVVGTRPERHDALEKVTGSAKYGADVHLPGMLHGRVKRSPHAHARIKSIDASKALALPGVKAVITGTDFPRLSTRLIDVGEGALSNRAFMSENCIARDKVLYKGHALAAVAATSQDIADHALDLIEVDYEVLPSVMDGREAMKPNSPILHERLTTKGGPGAAGTLSNDEVGEPTNVAAHYEYATGDLEKGFAEAYLVVEEETHTKAVHQGYIEPHSATAEWLPNGEITIRCSSQGQFQIREQSALVLDVPVSKIKVIQMEIGGGFGGKLGVYLEPLAALLSKRSGLPVKITMSRTEVFEATGPTSGTHVKVKMGVTKDGLITAAEAILVYEGRSLPRLSAEPGMPVHTGPLHYPQRSH